MFSLIKTPYCNTNPPVTIYALLSNFWISWFTRFFAPPRPGPPRGFSSSPRPAPLEKALPRTSLLNMLRNANYAFHAIPAKFKTFHSKFQAIPAKFQSNPPILRIIPVKYQVNLAKYQVIPANFSQSRPNISHSKSEAILTKSQAILDKYQAILAKFQASKAKYQEIHAQN